MCAVFLSLDLLRLKILGSPAVWDVVVEMVEVELDVVEEEDADASAVALFVFYFTPLEWRPNKALRRPFFGIVGR